MIDSITPQSPLDLLVVGGGCVGTAVAMFAARAGLRTGLVEGHDFGSGTTGASTEMIHGGLQYLAKLQLGIVRQSNQYAWRIYRSAPHLCRPLPIVCPSYRDGPTPYWSLRALIAAYEVFNRAYKHAPPQRPLSAAEIASLVPDIARQGLRGGVCYHEWWIDAPRLCLANAQAAAQAGAWVRNHAPVVRLGRSPSQPAEITIRDRRLGREQTLLAHCVVNATGPWTDALCRLAGVPGPRRIRPTRGVHLLLPRLADVGLLVPLIDKRFGVAIPRGPYTLLGTTDDDYYGDLDDQLVTPDEQAYLLEGLRTLLPRVSSADVVDTKVGVRPTIYQFGVTEDKVSRDHRVELHAQQHSWLISVYGGKLATHTLMAEDALRTVARQLERTIDVPANYTLPAAVAEEPAAYAAQAASSRVGGRSLDATQIELLVRRYGSAWRDVLAPAEHDATLWENLCQCPAAPGNCHSVLAAEVLYATRHEWALTLDDIRRRTGLGVGTCRTHGCLARAARLLSEPSHAQ